MIQVRIHDIAFAHVASLSGLQVPSHFTWCRDKQCNTHNPDIAFFTDCCLASVEASNARRKIAWLIEPPTIRGDSYVYARNCPLFDYILSYDRSMASDKRFLYYAASGCWIRGPGDRRGLPYDVGIYPKRKLISIIASEKQWLEGHILRHDIIAKHSTIEAFGNAANRHIDEKIEGLRDYMFSVVTENTMVNDLFTEKLVDCFATGTIPIYWGTKNIGNYFDANGILQFTNLEEFDMIMSQLSPELYNSKLQSIQENYNRHFQFRTPEDRIWDHYPFLFQ